MSDFWATTAKSMMNITSVVSLTEKVTGFSFRKDFEFKYSFFCKLINWIFIIDIHQVDMYIG